MEASVTEAPWGWARLAAPPLLQQEPKWPACVKGSQEEVSGAASCSNYLASLEKQAQTREGVWGRHQSCYTSALPDTQPLLTTTRHCPSVGRPKLQCKDKQKMLILSFCFYKGPPLDNERILKGYFDDRWFLPQESDFGDSTVEWPEQEGCGQTRKAGNAGAVPAGWLTSSPCKKCTFIPISFLSWGYIELMRKTCGKDSQLLDNGMRR